MAKIKRHIAIRDAVYRLIKRDGPLTAVEIVDKTVNYRGVPYHDMPAAATLSQILLRDGRFETVGQVRVRYMGGQQGMSLVWGVKDEK